jgi:hypothetical protein
LALLEWSKRIGPPVVWREANMGEYEENKHSHGVHPLVTPADQVTAFLNYFTPSNANYYPKNPNNANTLIQLFTADNPPQGTPTSPVVGITLHGSINGPGFIGRTAIGSLFAQLFTCFSQLTFAPIDPAPYIGTASTIAVRLYLTGTNVGSWFSQGNPIGNNYSLPLSEIQAVGNTSINLPACAVFTFSSTSIQQLGIYMDRFQLMTDLQPEPAPLFKREIRKFLRGQY